MPTSGIFRFGCELCHLNKGKLYQQAFVLALSVVQVAVVAQLHGFVKELWCTFLRLSLVSVSDRSTGFQQLQGRRVSAYQQVSEMRSQPRDEMVAVKSFSKNIIESEQAFGYFIFQEEIGQLEIIFVVQYVQVLNHTLVGDVSVGEAHYLVEDGEGITHTPVSFLCDDVQGFRFGFDVLLAGYVLQVFHRIVDRDAAEVVNLAPAQDGGKNFMLLSGGQNENGMLGRLFQCLQKGIECGGRQHVYLVNDIHLVLADLGRDAYLLNQGTDVFD